MHIIELQYLPSPHYIALLKQNDDIEIDKFEYYTKQTYRNRCRILTANGVDELSVPVLGAGKKKLAKDIKIDYSQKWVNRHWRGIQSAYGKSPFFEHYSPDFHHVYQKNHPYLFDLSAELLTLCLDFLQLDLKIIFTSDYHDLKNEPQSDLRSRISPKLTSSGFGTYKQVNYRQVFGNKFVDNLSVIDLIFCEGPEAGNIIKSGLRLGTE